jgi:TIR domain-containing protein
VNTRNVVFISHANPEDNPFTIWLGAKLAAAGYEVWADVLRVRGGQDWQRKLEDAIRNRACKVLFAANQVAAGKQGVRNELQIASDTGKKIGDSDFIIPLRLGDFEKPFLVAHAQYINFERSWASGLKELLETLQDTYKLPGATGNIGTWLDLQLINGKKLTDTTEQLISTWLEVRRLPQWICYNPDFNAVAKDYPRVPFKDGAITCVKQKGQGCVSCRVSHLLASGWPALELAANDGWKKFADIANQAFGNLLRDKGLKRHEMASPQPAWWVPATGPQGRLSFKWPGISGSRQIQGTSTKRGVRWHFGISPSFNGVPFHHIRLKSRLIFTQDGNNPLDSAVRAHALRRSFAKGWRNARWRDMLLSFLYWFGDGTTVVDVPVGPDQALVLSLPPLAFGCPVGVEDAADISQDEDDPDVEFDPAANEELEDEDPQDEDPE